MNLPCLNKVTTASTTRFNNLEQGRDFSQSTVKFKDNNNFDSLTLQ